MADQQQLAELIERLIAADIGETRRLIEEHADPLLSDVTQGWLAQAITTEPDEEHRAKLKWHAELLDACRAYGIEATFALVERVRLREALQVFALRLASAPPDWQALEEALRIDPWLIQDDFLAQALQVLRDRVDTHLAFLVEAKADGLEAALNRRDVQAASSSSVDITALPQDVQDLLMALHRLLRQGHDPTTLRQAVELVRAALARIDRRRHPNVWTAQQHNLGLVLTRLGQFTGSVETLHQAEAAFREALQERTRERVPMNWAEIQDSLGLMLDRLGEVTGSAETLRQAEAAFRAALEERTHERAPKDWGDTQINLGSTLLRLGELTGSAETLRQAEAAFRAALQERTRERAPMAWADTQIKLGGTLLRLGELTGSAEILRQAEAAFREALQERTRERAPMAWANIQNNLGTVLMRLGELTGSAEILRQAEATFRDALEERTRERAPEDWAASRDSLGNVLALLGGLTGSVEILRQAETAFRDALAEYTRERAPKDWAITQNNLGILLARLGELTGSPETLRQSETAFREALRERTRERAPKDWGDTLTNLGIVLMRLGEFTGSVETLRQAEAACRDAHQERTRERAPKDWAMTQANLGSTLGALGQFTGSVEILRQAEVAFRDVLAEYTREGAPMHWAMTQANLGTLLTRLGELTGSPETLRQAETAFREALREYTRERTPMEWALTQNNLGGTLAELSELTDSVETLRRAEAAFRAALEERTRERAPKDWADTQNNLGSTLMRLGRLTGSIETMRQAEVACLNALQERTRERAPMAWADTQTNLGSTLVWLGRLTGSIEIMRQAEAAFRAALEERTRERGPTAHARVRRALAELLFNQSRWHEAATALQDLLDDGLNAVFSARTITDRKRLLADLNGLSAKLALARLRLGQPEEALLAAGRGRAVLLQAANADERLATDVGVAAQIRSAQKAWHEASTRFDRAEARLISAFAPDPGQKEALTAFEAADAAVSAAYAHLASLLAAADLDKPSIPNIGAIAAAIPAGGVLAVPVVTSLGGAVIVLRHAQTTIGDADILLLDTLTDAAFGRLLLDHGQRSGAHGEPEPTGWLVAYASFRSAVEATQGQTDLDTLTAWNTQIGRTGEALWDLLIGPLHYHLRRLGLAEGAEVVFMPPGHLARLPLHAARRRDLDARDIAAHNWRYAVEDWTFSTIPSLNSLIDCAKRASEPCRQGRRLLAVTNPGCDLRLAGRTTFANPAEVPGFTACDRLEREAATLERVLMLLDGKHSHLSFYCHGNWDFLQPEHSALIMAGHGQPIAQVEDMAGESAASDSQATDELSEPRRVDGRLSMSCLRRLELSASRLAILAACETGLSDISHLPDEALGLPTGLLEAGVPAVAATLWLVEAQATHTLVRRFVGLQLSGLSPAHALRQAQVEHLRGATVGLDSRNRKTTPSPASEVDADAGSDDGDLVPLPHVIDAVGDRQISAGSTRTLAAFVADDDPLPDLPASSGAFSLSGTEPFFWAAFTMSGR
jgi:CHAT domain-containing protein/tetratricopeptide (TPR) repeat protein